jgi:ABC-type nitrate/sulfonate/bicarbonate transport system substrate-binding protein
VVTELTLGSFSPSVVLRVARRTGRLEERAIAVREEPVASSPAQFRALLAGDLDAALTSPDNVVAYRFAPANPLGRTADVCIVMAVDRGLGLGLYGRQGVTSADDLRGGTVAVDVATSGFAFALFALLESLGLGRDDYRLVELGSTPRRLEALLDGGCDATMLNAGNELRAEDAGCLRLAAAVDVCEPYLGTVLCVTGAPTRPVAALASALQAATCDVLSGAAYDVAVAEAAAALHLPPALAQRYVERLADPREGLVADGAVDPDALATVVGLRRAHLPSVVDGEDTLARALHPGSGLVAPVLPVAG